MRVSYIYGMADLLHYGHIEAMRKAAAMADLCIFGLVSDAASEAWFGAHVSDEKERRAAIEGIKYIDEVWDQMTFDPLDNLRLIHSKYPSAKITLFTGNDWGVVFAKRYLESIGGNVEKLEYYKKLSPQAILDVLNKNEIIRKPINNNLISTKANTLQSLKGILTKGIIEDLLIVTIGEFEENSSIVTKKINEFFHGEKIVVRSSSKREDAFEESNAGHFVSFLDVDSRDEDEVASAIRSVINSYGENEDNEEQVLIQKMTKNVLLSGVVFTRDIQRNRPYYVINYDDSGSTDSVTSGSKGKSIWIANSANRKSIPQKWMPLMDAVWELENILNGTLLDIEFAITNSKVIIFQVRPLAAAYKFNRKSDGDKIETVKNLAKDKYKILSKKGCTCFSDMAFWNPAEIIGDNPRNLDYSLYREIITKSAWNIGLVPMGYRKIDKELMFRFGNKPFISIERSFDSLIPAAISNDFAIRLRDYYVEKLKNNLSAHDKIEFEISHNCFDFSTTRRLAELIADGFRIEDVLELKSALKNLTVKTIDSYSSILKKDREDIRALEIARLDAQNVVNSTDDYKEIAKIIRTLINAIETFGTPQFSRQARCAFISKSICHSLVDEGYISSEVVNQFLSKINTVAVDFDIDYHSVIKGEMSLDIFKGKYGHLRAGTYNIRSLRYDQMESLFSDKILEEKEQFDSIDYDADEAMRSAVDNALVESDLQCVSSEEIIYFIKQSIVQREYFKFIFTKSLSFAIELIKRIGKKANIDVCDISYLELPEIFAAEYYSSLDKLQEFWSLIIGRRRELYNINSKIILPEVISDIKDFDFIESIVSRPNYITENRIIGEVAVIEYNYQDDLDGKIVVIEKADPGYDWIFSKGIAGLVTKYGGVASHMAIRCAEFKVPAAIGCGTNLFNYVTESKSIDMDCKHMNITRIE